MLWFCVTYPVSKVSVHINEIKWLKILDISMAIFFVSVNKADNMYNHYKIVE